MGSKDAVMEAVGVCKKVVPISEEQQGEVQLELVYTVSDKDGNVRHEQVETGHSFLSNFIKMLFCHMMFHHAPDTGSVLTLTDTGGTVRTGLQQYAHEINSTFMDCNATSAIDDYGILVGTGSTAVDIDDYALDTKVVEGTGSGQMEHGNHSIVNSTHDGSSYSYAGITRTFANNSGGSIVVAEIGLACRNHWESTTNRYFLLLREVLGATVTVLDTEVLTVTIRVKCFC